MLTIDDIAQTYDETACDYDANDQSGCEAQGFVVCASAAYDAIEGEKEGDKYERDAPPKDDSLAGCGDEVVCPVAAEECGIECSEGFGDTAEDHAEGSACDTHDASEDCADGCYGEGNGYEYDDCYHHGLEAAATFVIYGGGVLVLQYLAIDGVGGDGGAVHAQTVFGGACLGEYDPQDYVEYEGGEVGAYGKDEVYYAPHGNFATEVLR